jgi:competence protein ComFC
MHEECREVSHLDGLIYVTTYSKVVSDVLKDIKYKYYFDVINSLSDIMADYLKVYKFDDITISFAPIHAVKLRSRGFDQSELLAKSIADKSNFDFMKLLYRNRQTLTQVGLSKVERESNLKGAFNLRDTLPYLPKSVMLIDDIFTTGSTLNECAKVLKEGGVGQVYGFVFAKSRT